MNLLLFDDAELVDCQALGTSLELCSPAHDETVDQLQLVAAKDQPLQHPARLKSTDGEVDGTDPTYCGASRYLRVVGDRAVHLRKILAVIPGSRVRVGMVNGGIGNATVIAVDDTAVTLAVGELKTLPQPRWQVDLILAMPRPQSLKKVLQTAATMGVRSIRLIGAARVEKGYFSSPVLSPESIYQFLRLGLEQGGATQLPTVSVHPVRSEVFATLEGGPDSETMIRLLADPGATTRLYGYGVPLLKSSNAVTVAIGPEGGWLAAEVEKFKSLGFLGCALGNRILRVETAVCAFLAQLDLMRDVVR